MRGKVARDDDREFSFGPNDRECLRQASVTLPVTRVRLFRVLSRSYNNPQVPTNDITEAGVMLSDVAIPLVGARSPSKNIHKVSYVIPKTTSRQKPKRRSR